MKDLWDKIQNGVFVIAEIGKGFIQTEEDQSAEVYLQNAKKLVDEAKRAGADAVKFQTHTFEDEQMPIEVTAPHFKGSDRYNWVKRNTLATPVDKFWLPLKKYCDEQGIIFFSTPMSRGAAQLLETIDVPLWKIGSGDILDFVMLDFIRNTSKPIIISSGMSTLEEVDKAVNFLRQKNNRVALLHCVSRYPCPPEDLNLGTITFFKNRYNMPIGFSDHSIGIDSALGAVAMGAAIIEKHFSLSRDLWGSDHRVAMIPEEMRALTQGIKEMQDIPSKKEEYLDKEIVRKSSDKNFKVLQDDEAVFRPLFRKTLMASADIPKGTVLTPELLYAMRPQAYLNGLPSEKYEEILAKKVKKDLKKYEAIALNSFV